MIEKWIVESRREGKKQRGLTRAVDDYVKALWGNDKNRIAKARKQLNAALRPFERDEKKKKAKWVCVHCSWANDNGHASWCPHKGKRIGGGRCDKLCS